MRYETVQFGVYYQRANKVKKHPVKTRNLAGIVGDAIGFKDPEKVADGVWYYEVPLFVWTTINSGGFIEIKFNIPRSKGRLTITLNAEMA